MIQPVISGREAIELARLDTTPLSLTILLSAAPFHQK
jgi:hypothetical protein